MIIEICVNNNVNQDKLLVEVEKFIVNRNIEGDEFLLCDEETLKEKAIEYVQNSLHSCYVGYIMENLDKNVRNKLSKDERQQLAKLLQKIQEELGKDANPLFKAIVDINELMEDVAETGGYGYSSFLSSYLKEYVLNFAGETYYLYPN